MRDIVRLLDERYDHVVDVLIDQGLVFERRKNPCNIEVDRRRSIVRKPQLENRRDSG